ncbi:MAG: aspartyl/asparaginyl beta-hydroxylase domain-containing protein [bacterium]
MNHVAKPDTLCDLGPVDIAPIQALVARLPDRLWDVEDDRKENKFDVFHDTRHIIFRFIEGMRDHRCYYSNPIWEVWKGHLVPIFEQATSGFGFREPAYPKAMLARLAAGAVIDRHTDGAGSNLFTHKLHVPLTSNDGVTMFIRDRPFKLDVGRVYEVNNIVPHSVENRGADDRIHLIFEVFDEAEPAGV